MRVAAAAAALFVFVQPALGHGFENRYEQSLPSWLFFAGSVLTVVVSFALVSVFASRRRESSYRAMRLAATPLRFVQSPRVVRATRAGVVFVFAVGILVGTIGPQEYDANLYTLLVWVVWWVGYTFSVILVGNTWPVVNPWLTVYEWMVVLVGDDPSLGRDYRWGALPALLMLFGFGWLEFVSPVSTSPRSMVAVTVAYSAVTWAGMLVYGRSAWVDSADPFARLYRYLGKFAPLSSENGGELRMYGVRLVESDDSLDASGALAFVVVILYLVTFDGFVATPAWRALALWVPQVPVPLAVTTVLMVAGLAAFVEAYLTFARLINRAAGTSFSDLRIARRFALSLLPIAIAYQISHYYVLLLQQGQLLVPALADPFGLGWNLLGLGAFEPSKQLPFLSVELLWQSQVVLVVVGHVVAVWVAHHIALDVFADRQQAVKSQLPMMGLMIVYTMLSLWILTLPVIEPPLP